METSQITKFLSRTILVLGTFGSIVISSNMGKTSNNALWGFCIFIGLFLSVAISATLIKAVGEILDKLEELSDGIKSLNESNKITENNQTQIIPPDSSSTSTVPAPKETKSTQKEVIPLDLSNIDKEHIIEEINKFDDATELNNYIAEVIKQKPNLFNSESRTELEKSLRIAKMYGNTGSVESYRKIIMDFLYQQ